MSEEKKPRKDSEETPEVEESTSSDRRKFLGLTGAAAAAAVVGAGSQIAEAASVKSKILARIKSEVDSQSQENTGLYTKEAWYSKGQHNYRKGGFSKEGGYTKGISYGKRSSTLPADPSLPASGAQ